jgi:hypothetical protein
VKYVRVYAYGNGGIARNDYEVNGHKARKRPILEPGSMEKNWVILFESKKMRISSYVGGRLNPRQPNWAIIIHPSLVE